MNTALQIIAAPRTTKPAWPQVVDERDMDEVKRLSQREIDLLDQLLRASLESNKVQQEAINNQKVTTETHNEILKQLLKADADQEKRIRTLEKLGYTVGGIVGFLTTWFGVTRLYAWLAGALSATPGGKP